MINKFPHTGDAMSALYVKGDAFNSDHGHRNTGTMGFYRCIV